MQLLDLEIELAFTGEQIVVDNVKVRYRCQERARDFCQLVKKAAIKHNCNEPGNDGRR